jgi:hypothetical protein
MTSKTTMSTKLCGCGTIHDAFEEAERRLMRDLEQGFCLSWAIQLAAAQSHMAVKLARAMDYPSPVMIALFNRDGSDVAMAVLSQSSNDDVEQRIRAKLAELKTDERDK